MYYQKRTTGLIESERTSYKDMQCHDPRDRGYISYVILSMSLFELFYRTQDSESLC